mgnify:FL=1
MKEFYLFGRKIIVGMEKENEMKLPKGMYFSEYEKREPLPKGMYYADEFCELMKKRKKEKLKAGASASLDTVIENSTNQTDINQDSERKYKS